VLESPRLLTVGHGALAAEELTALLVGAGVELLVDVRRFPGSRAHPHLARDQLEQWLPAGGVDYRWEERLGGRRRLPAGSDGDGGGDGDVEDGWWQVAQFRAYAAHTRTPEFAAALADVLTEARQRGVAVMCSESVWWRCHRRLIADVVCLTTDLAVEHLAHDGRTTAHPVAAGAVLRADGRVAWPTPPATP
jgi:uncharacterized protein (DUF488 family)